MKDFDDVNADLFSEANIEQSNDSDNAEGEISSSEQSDGTDDSTSDEGGVPQPTVKQVAGAGDDAASTAPTEAETPDAFDEHEDVIPITANS